MIAACATIDSMRSKPLSRAAVELRRIMIARALSQRAVADAVSPRVGRRLSQATVGRALSGESIPSGPLVSALAVVYGIDAGWWSEPADSQAA
ncbi:MAG TPA: helix-turn-helix transcriptional regulator [Polyangiaceae bacterium]|nr:helix-turn-helix transcriptional regulator [Polyangiaceae bacterium]